MLWYYKLKSLLTNTLVITNAWYKPQRHQFFTWFYKECPTWDTESYILRFDNNVPGLHHCYSLEGPDVYKGFKKIPFHSLMNFLI